MSFTTFLAAVVANVIGNVVLPPKMLKILKIDRSFVKIKMTHDKGMTDESLRSDLSPNNQIILFPLLVNQK